MAYTTPSSSSVGGDGTSNPNPAATGSMSNPSATSAAERSSAAIEDARESARKVVDRVADKSTTAVQNLSATGDRLMNIEQRYANATKDYVRTNPFTSMALAVCAGVLLSRMWPR